MAAPKIPSPESTSTIKDLTGKIHGVSISGGSGGRGSSSGSGPWSSPASGLALHRGQHSRQYRSPTGSNGSDVRSNGSVKPLKEEESGGYGSANVEKALSVPSGFSMVRRKKDFRCMERVRGRLVNVLEGLELHTGVFSVEEQKKIVDYVYDIQEKGRKGMLRERTYSEPRKWMRGKGRVTVQFGCCYNYAMDKNGNPPGIIRDEEVDPIPPLLKSMIKRMVEWHVLPPTCIPNSCIINIYDKDDCIPPHIDHHDFVRPFCTVSFLTECNILFGADLKILGPGEFSGSTAIPLPKGISITFRKMDDAKHPFEFTPDPELQNLRPLPLPVSSALPKQQQSQQRTPPSQTQQTSSHSSNWSSGDQNSSGDVSHSSNGTPGDKSTSEKKQSIASGEKFVSPVQFVDDDFPSFSQKQSQQRTQPSQASRHCWNPRDQTSNGNASGYSDVSSADKSTGEKKQSIIASGEKFVSPVKFGDDEFPSLGSGAFSKPSRKPGRSLRQ
ncbi:uncharacterized protein A4U43_C10F18130 [Asparagus officinalis]|uniref:Uncharacterized protein n=1 Tax=Asparagus officinalis TaxID=4686 RepID=A0A5P1E456_ASPOF|nr:uncharacterized protein A4U43_C10F18130 [Asparagus officinalis]